MTALSTPTTQSAHNLWLHMDIIVMVTTAAHLSLKLRLAASILSSQY